MRHEFQLDIDFNAVDSGVLHLLGAQGLEVSSDRDKLVLRAIWVWLVLTYVLMACWGCLLLCAKRCEGLDMEALEREEEEEELDCHLSTEISDADVAQLSEGSPTWGQLLSFAWTSARSVANLAFLSYTAYTGSPPQENKPWALERKIVTQSEGIVASTLLAALTGSCAWACLGPIAKVADAFWNFKTIVTMGANFSFLKCLPLANPIMLWGQVKKFPEVQVYIKLQTMRTPAKLGVFVVTCALGAMLWIFLASVAMLSICIKVAKFGFIAEGMPWTFRNYLDFVFFVNALTGLRGDIETQRLNVIFGAMDATKSPKVGFEKKLAAKLLTIHGRFAGFVSFVTM